MPLVINSYITPHLPYLRTPLYYLTWTAYYLTYLVSPGLLTILQLICMLLEHLLPRVEYWVESEMRERLRRCEWAQEDSRRNGKGLRKIARERMGGNVGVGETTGWVLGAWRWVGGLFGTGGTGVKGTNQIGKSERFRSNLPCECALSSTKFFFLQSLHRDLSLLLYAPLLIHSPPSHLRNLSHLVQLLLILLSLQLLRHSIDVEQEYRGEKDQ